MKLFFVAGLEGLTMRFASCGGVRIVVFGGAVVALTACATMEPVHIACIELHQFASAGRVFG